MLVTTRVNPAQGPREVADAADFPIERISADAHPVTFEALYGTAKNDPESRVHRVRPESRRSG